MKSANTNKLSEGQHNIYNRILHSIEVSKNKIVTCNFPTGFGKDFIAQNIIIKMLSDNKKVLLVSNRFQLEFMKSDLIDLGIENDTIKFKRDKKSLDANLLLSTVYGLSKYKEELGQFDAVILLDRPPMQNKLYFGLVEDIKALDADISIIDLTGFAFDGKNKIDNAETLTI